MSSAHGTPGTAGWHRLWRHSYRLGLAWSVREARHLWPHRRTGVARLLVPLDPWRYYELGVVAEQEFSGRCLDISSPKLLPSLLQREGKGEWLCVDLFEREVEAWRRIDPALALEVQDATSLPYDDGTFDNIACISVLEHIGHATGADAAALAEAFRVLKPGGVLHLTTDVRRSPGDVFVDDRLYGQASVPADGGRVFFKHDYSPQEIDALVAALPWQVLHEEYAVQRDPGLERRFYARAPLSYVYGGALRFSTPSNFTVAPSREVLGDDEHGVVYLRLRKPGAGGPGSV
jgi:SAM-dependent methyltransferase